MGPHVLDGENELFYQGIEGEDSLVNQVVGRGFRKRDTLFPVAPGGRYLYLHRSTTSPRDAPSNIALLPTVERGSPRNLVVSSG